MTKTLTIIGDSIPLPKRLMRRWQGKRVQLEQTEGSLVVKLLPTRPLKELLVLTRQAGKTLTRKDLDEAIAAVRAQVADRH